MWLRLIAFDFDGVFTDNKVHVEEDGSESVTCSRGDGLGIDRLRRAGIEAAVLSTETNRVVAARCRKLGLPFAQGHEDKGSGLRRLAEEKGLNLDEVAFLGNDINDLECLRLARVALVPADACAEVRRVVTYVLRSRGGNGAVREVCEMAVAASRRRREESQCEPYVSAIAG